jgi:MFS family permease
VATGLGLPPNYRWIVLLNTTIATLLATINSSILLIALPDIFRGIRIDPLAPGNTNYLLWMILGYLIVLAVLVTTLGRLGDMFGRVRTYNLGFSGRHAVLGLACGDAVHRRNG